MTRFTTPPASDVLDALIRAAIANAANLVDEADCLSERRFWPRTHFLAATALEELSKVQILANVQAGDEPPEALENALTSHERKYAYLKRHFTDASGPAAESPSRAFGKAAKRLREAALYVGLSEDHTVLSPSAEITEEQARHTLQAAHDELSMTNLLSVFPRGLTTKGARAFADRRRKDEA